MQSNGSPRILSVTLPSMLYDRLERQRGAGSRNGLMREALSRGLEIIEQEHAAAEQECRRSPKGCDE